MSQQASGQPVTSVAMLTAIGWAINPKFFSTEGKSPFLGFLLKTEKSGTHEIKVFGDQAEKFKDLHEDEPVSVTAKASRQQIMDGDKPVTNSRGRELWDTHFVVNAEFGTIEDAPDLGAPPAKEKATKPNGGGRPRGGDGGGGRPARGATPPSRTRR